MIYKIVIPGWKPTSDNKLIGAKWPVVARLKNKDAQVIGGYATKAKIPKAATRRRVTIAISVHRGRSPDPENFKKSVHDALVNCGLLVDDSFRWLEAAPASVRRDVLSQTEITIEDIEDIQGC